MEGCDLVTLKVALLCDGADKLEPWMHRLAEGICRAPQLELSAILTLDDPVETREGGALFKAWWSFESRLLAKAQPAIAPAFEEAKADLPVRVAGEEDAGADVIVNLTAETKLENLAGRARLGIWSPGTAFEAEGASALRAIIGKTPVTEISLVQQTDSGQLRLVASASLNTKFAVSRNHLFMKEKLVALILRELKRAERGALDTSNLAPAPAAMRAPSNLDLPVYLTRFAGNMAARLIEKAATKIGLRPGMFFLKTSDATLSQADPSAMRAHPTPANEYYADPFLWDRDGETWCFFEVYDYTTGRGHISAGRFDAGELVDVTPVLKTDYHLSFPFLFERDGELYMMPETCGANRIETWRCVEYPHHWEREATILDNVIAADSSLAQIGDDWWLFTNISNDPFGEMNSELHLYKVDGPGMTELTPHVLNPVVFDSRTARNGGRILERDGAYYRISQDNSHGRYGYGVNVMKIDHISLDDYRETMVRKIEPDFEPGAIGCHHLDSRGDMVVMDVRRRVGGFASKGRAARRRHG